MIFNIGPLSRLSNDIGQAASVRCPGHSWVFQVASWPSNHVFSSRVFSSLEFVYTRQILEWVKDLIAFTQCEQLIQHQGLDRP